MWGIASCRAFHTAHAVSMSTTVSLPSMPPLRLSPSPVPLLRLGATHDGSRPDRLVVSGAMTRIIRGVYADSTAWSALAPWDRYLARTHAVALVSPDSIFCLESAAALRGHPVFGEPPHVHVLRLGDGTSRSSSTIREHRTQDRRDLQEIDGLLLTSGPDTAVDLARNRHAVVGLSAADAALRADPHLSAAVLRATSERRASSRGRRQARWSLRRADARAANAMESISRAIIEWLGYAEPELQAAVQVPQGERFLDFFWRREGIGGEADGRWKYDGRFGDPTNIVYMEKRREDAIRQHLTGFARWGWPELTAPRELDDALTRTGLRRIRPIDHAALAGIPQALRGSPR